MAEAVPELEPSCLACRRGPASSRPWPRAGRGSPGDRLPGPAGRGDRGLGHLAGSAERDSSRPAPARVVEEGVAVGVVLEDGTPHRADCGAGGRRALDAAARRSGRWLATDRPHLGRDLQLRLGRPPRATSWRRTRSTPINRAAAATERAAHANPRMSLPRSSASPAPRDQHARLHVPAGEPDPAVEPLLLRRAATFLPAVAEAEVVRAVCAPGRNRSTAARSSVRSRASRTCSSAPDTVRGASAPVRRPPRSSRGPSSTAPPPPAELDAGRPLGHGPVEHPAA
jgi:hypothetical protein